VRTKNPGLDGTLVGYTLLGTRPEGRLAGFLVLQPDVEGWYAARADFDPARVFAALHGACRELLIAPLALDLLSTEDRELLLAGAASVRDDPGCRAAWLGWATRAGTADTPLSPEALLLLSRLRGSLTDEAAGRGSPSDL
jgi:hypothetical protein